MPEGLLPLLLVAYCLILWIGGAFVLCDVAKRRGNSPRRFLWYGFVYGPVIGALFLISMPPKDSW